MPVLLQLSAPEFNPEELALLETLRRSTVWEKIFQHLDAQLVSALLDTRRDDITQELRRGYLWCRVELQSLPAVPPEPQPDEDRNTSMQFEDEPDED